MGQNVKNIEAYYHGNDGERGLKFSVHCAFDEHIIARLNEFVLADDPKGFLEFMKAENPEVYGLLRDPACAMGAFNTLKESGVLAIQQTRMVTPRPGPYFPVEVRAAGEALVREVEGVLVTA